MRLYFNEYDENQFVRLDDDIPTDRSKIVWIFPDINKSFPAVLKDNGSIIIDPSMYYITSGEAVRKTEVLLSDIKEQIEKHPDKMCQLTNLLLDVNEFYELLIEVKASSKYLEITKCEDGLYDGNVCSRKDPKKRKLT